MTKPYVLDKKAQSHFNKGTNTLWQAVALLEIIQQAHSGDEYIQLNSALNGVLTLMSDGLTDLAEV